MNELNTNKQDCKSLVAYGNGFHFRHCKKPIFKDGYCKCHHPETIQMKREVKHKRWESERENSPTARLIKAESELARLKAAISSECLIKEVVWASPYVREQTLNIIVAYQAALLAKINKEAK